MKNNKSLILLSLLFSFIVLFVLLDSLFDFFQKRYYDVINIKTISNTIIIPVSIDGNIYNFEFDTGASTSISNELFSKLNLSINDSCESIDYYGNRKRVYKSIISELIIGKTKFSNIKTGIIRPIQSFMSCGMKIDGYLGNDIFSNGTVQIDIKNKRLVISNSIKLLNVNNENSIDFETNEQKIPFLLVNFLGIDATEKVMFDIGSGNYFYRLEKNTFLSMVKNGHIKQTNILDTLDYTKNGSALFGKQKEDEIYFVKFDSVRIFGKTIYNLPSYTFSSGYFSILGAPILNLGVITLDYKGQKLYFKPYHDDKIDLKPIHGFTMSSNKKSQLVVETVLKNSIAQKKGIKKDFILKKLNTIYLDSLTLCDLFELDWSKEYGKSIVNYIFKTNDNKEVAVKIEK